MPAEKSDQDRPWRRFLEPYLERGAGSEAEESDRYLAHILKCVEMPTILVCCTQKAVIVLEEHLAPSFAPPISFAPSSTPDLFLQSLCGGVLTVLSLRNTKDLPAALKYTSDTYPTRKGGLYNTTLVVTESVPYRPSHPTALKLALPILQ